LNEVQDVDIPPMSQIHSMNSSPFPGLASDASFAGIASSNRMPGGKEPVQRFQLGDRILGRYEVREELGQGGMGEVYSCFDELAGIEVALKALPPRLSHDAVAMRLIRENFQLVHRLHHPNIAAVTNLEQDPESGNYYLIMERVEGMDLARLCRQEPEKKLTLDRALPILKQVAEALDFAHSRQIIHRDIKPSNLMVLPDGAVKVLDFGLAADTRPPGDQAVLVPYDSMTGTAPYMPPEQWSGLPQGPKTDQYALAATFYEILAGHPPFVASNPDTLRDVILNAPPQRIAGLPDAAWAAIAQGLTKDPAARFASCAEMMSAVRPDIQPVVADSGSEPERKPVRNRMIRLIGLALPALAVAGWLVWGGKHTGSEQFLQGLESPSEGKENKIGPETGKNWAIPGLSLTMIWVPPGQFEMGSYRVEDDEKPLHSVEISNGFWIGQTEVTNGQWDAFTKATGYDGTEDPEYLRHHRDWKNFASDAPDYPVVCVSWYNVTAFCQWLTQREAEAGRLPERYEYRLPTEAEWEFAARGGEQNERVRYVGGNRIERVAWFNENSQGQTHPVGQKKANSLRIYDMSGNVWEWCWDRYDPAYYSRSPASDPTGPDSGWNRVYRGGAWLEAEVHCRTSNRDFHPANHAEKHLGFRVALGPEIER
jgi:formylglycine-generating enzyme required for sulfatase activity